MTRLTTLAYPDLIGFFFLMHFVFRNYASLICMSYIMFVGMLSMIFEDNMNTGENKNIYICPSDCLAGRRIIHA